MKQNPSELPSRGCCPQGAAAAILSPRPPPAKTGGGVAAAITRSHPLRGGGADDVTRGADDDVTGTRWRHSRRADASEALPEAEAAL